MNPPANQPKPHPISAKTLWSAIGIIAVVMLGFGAWAVGHWSQQAQAERATLEARLVALKGYSRAQLEQAWTGPHVKLVQFHEPAREAKARWLPTPDAAEALAVLPRSPDKDFDAIYALYSGDHTSATLCLTPIGGYFNGQRLDKRNNPGTLLPNPMSAAEKRDLGRIIGLLEASQERTRRENPLDMQAAQFTWTQQVIATAQQLLAAQGQ